MLFNNIINMKEKKSPTKSQADVLHSVREEICGEVHPEMPSALEVAQSRARVAMLERELAAMRDAGDSSSDSEDRRLAGELEPLRLPDAAPAAPRAAAALLPRLAAALDARFLHDYLRVLETDDVARIQAVTEELMQCIEDALAADGSAASCGRDAGVALGAWLSAAVVWAWPRMPRAHSALLSLLEAFEPLQVERLGGALQDALVPHELLALSDAVRGGRGGAEPLGELLRHAAGGAGAGAGAGWTALGAAEQLRALRAAARGRGALGAAPAALAQEVKVFWNKVQELCKPDA
ncbi:uncharacterized protein [Epargyreus clarus]|uniref:uncharacterized protein isoform X2 n=1 Tax=Epargyreus clarus TaxID=520877 RepID=UPI003C2B48C2